MDKQKIKRISSHESSKTTSSEISSARSIFDENIPKPDFLNLRRNGKLSFKNLVRAVIRASRWKVPLVTLKEEKSSDDIVKTWYEDKDTLHFNVNAFKVGSSGSAGLSKRARFILMKNAWERTEEELDLINSVVNQMKCFQKYPNIVRRELVRVMHFETFEDGRIIIQEGHVGFSMYFIVNGSVVAQVAQEDKRTGEKKQYVVGEIPAGSSFGELALVQDCRRAATISCKGTSQFLRVDKPDFDMVLKTSYEKEWEDRLKSLKSIPFFSSWPESDLKYINVNCKVRQYEHQDILFTENNMTEEFVYFIAHGVCQMVKKLCIMETPCYLNRNKTMVSLATEEMKESASKDPQKKLRERFFVLDTLTRGDFFGVGEDLTSTYIIASGKVECLMLSRHTLYSLERMTNSGNCNSLCNGTIKDQLRQAENRCIPAEEVFEKWMTSIRWKNYKKQAVNEVLSRKPFQRFNRPKAVSTKSTANRSGVNKKINPEKSNQNQKKIEKPIRKAGYELRLTPPERKMF